MSSDPQLQDPSFDVCGLSLPCSPLYASSLRMHSFQPSVNSQPPVKRLREVRSSGSKRLTDPVSTTTGQLAAIARLVSVTS